MPKINRFIKTNFWNKIKNRLHKITAKTTQKHFSEVRVFTKTDTEGMEATQMAFLNFTESPTKNVLQEEQIRCFKYYLWDWRIQKKACKAEAIEWKRMGYQSRDWNIRRCYKELLDAWRQARQTNYTQRIMPNSGQFMWTKPLILRIPFCATLKWKSTNRFSNQEIAGQSGFTKIIENRRFWGWCLVRNIGTVGIISLSKKIRGLIHTGLFPMWFAGCPIESGN
jgi:hypothetical protein